jgi:hypothetical protein
LSPSVCNAAFREAGVTLLILIPVLDERGLASNRDRCATAVM